MQAEYVLPSLVSLQQPPLFNSQRNAPEAVEPMNKYYIEKLHTKD